jgi:hypothetical protein
MQTENEAGPGVPLEPLVRLSITPITLREARSWVDRYHRHHGAPRGGIFALAVSAGPDVRGVAIVGRPVARNSADGWTAEVTRCCTDGSRNAPSMLYGAAWRAVRAMGYRRLITYTLPEEGGASLRASGFRLIGEAGGGSWSRETRPRIDMHPTQAKLRWELTA